MWRGEDGHLSSDLPISTSNQQNDIECSNDGSGWNYKASSERRGAESLLCVYGDAIGET
jgi:hypothetical protein